MPAPPPVNDAPLAPAPIAADHVVLVDEQDRVLGTEEKLRAHQTGALHRAFSAIVLDAGGRLLLQQRAFGKYHSGGLWSNTCCSHPRLGEPVAEAARRRTVEEMGMTCTFAPLFGFRYRAELDGGLIEHEYDHVLVSVAGGDPRPNADEVAGYRWVTVDALRDEVAAAPEAFTFWFQHLLDPFVDALQTRGLVDAAFRPTPALHALASDTA